MKYIKLVISIQDEYQETLISELLEMEFDAFEQQDGRIITYVPKERFSDVHRERIEGILRAYPGDGFIETEEVVADRNWNEEWEKTIVAQNIGKFYVKPTWQRGEPDNDSILLEIDPKMAFGTGYHETTRLMLKLLPSVIEGDDIVLDAGTGTGILAIAAIKLGADKAFAFDIDEWSITNTRENILLNGVEKKVAVRKGSLETIPSGSQYDVILANIERNTILDMLPKLKRLLKEEGRMLLSGLLEKDEPSVTQKLEDLELKVKEIRQENEWIAYSVENRIV
ncbi:50S ribosomal protein L11 methyltransferase [Balneolaceae bacterium YR4-1]|uniref:Ribosomal protein L11 methyltransferase n=1 Tax=Halalkalibaculum roseum TaxID=2709311 RepID=A0A6M1SU82_9BACT|nr:50S ribosomal protein L11 methyltransferase [Halalkalibaculum roseum]NGP76500.1 50S ribosomal protein L11 methyltransferase [Halalkalibaculum roseum]